MQKRIEDIRSKIAEEQSAPFHSTRAALTNADRECDKDSALAREYKEYVLREAKDAYIRLEAEEIATSDEMGAKAVDILCVSAQDYLRWTNPSRDEEPRLSVETTGMPALRQYMYGVTSQTNYRALYHHVFVTLA